MQVGINYLSECMYRLKSLSQVRRDLEKIRAHGFEAIRVTGNDLSWLVKIIKEAKKLKLKIWVCPRFAHSEPMLTGKEYLEKMKEFAKEVEKMKINVFLVGNELSLEILDFAPNLPTYEVRCGKQWQKFEIEFQERKNDFREYLITLAREAKKYFSGPVSYAAGTWEVQEEVIDWQQFDIVSANLYLWERFAEKEYIETLEKLKSYEKPIVITECGFTTTREAWKIGPRHIYGLRKFPKWILNLLLDHPNVVQKILRVNPKLLLKTKIPHHYDEEMQKKLLQKNLEILEKSNITQAFVFQWSEPFPAGFGLIRSDGTPKKALKFLKLIS